jgi:signal transduction histidine kinase
VGITPQDQQRVFEPFFRASSTSGDRLPDSTSLGLAIVLQLVKFMQGDIKMDRCLELAPPLLLFYR